MVFNIDESIIEEDPISSSDSEGDNPSVAPRPIDRRLEEVGRCASGSMGTSSTSTHTTGSAAPMAGTGSVRKVLRVPSKLIVKRAKM